MKAIEIKDKKLHLTSREKPVPASGEVLIKVAASGVNRPDIFQRLGHYPPPPGITDIPGLEVAGEIIESKDASWVAGQKVCALVAGGGYAEYVTAPAGQCLPVPQSLSMAEAAALPETIFTVWNNLFVRGTLKAGEIVLIHGGASGIGTAAIQMAKHKGATVIITAGSDDKCEACRALGADLAINYKTQDFAAEIAEHFPDGIDIVLDMIGGDYFAKNISLLRTDGRHVSIAHLNGAKAEINLRTIMLKRLTITGSTLRNRSLAEKRALRDGLAEKIWPLVEDGKIKPIIHAKLPLSEAAAAHDILEQSSHIGKVVLTAIND